MDKNAIKKCAVWARTELIARVSMKAEQYGIAEDNMQKCQAKHLILLCLPLWRPQICNDAQAFPLTCRSKNDGEYAMTVAPQ